MRFVVYLIGLVVVGVAAMIGLGFYLSPQDPLAKADAIVVISGGETDQRVGEGVNLWQERWAPTMIVSGAARDEGISNAAAMKRIAISLGMPARQIIVEDRAKTTMDNAQYVKEILEQQDMKSIILVTSPYHQRRAYLIFRHFLGSDFPIVNRSASDSAWRKNGWWSDDWARRLTSSELQKIIYLPILFRANR